MPVLLPSICIWNPTVTENVSFNKQEQHILTNNNVGEDGTLINNKSKVDFTIGINQLNDNNINKVETSKSFFIMDSTFGLRSYDKWNNVFPLSQSQANQNKEMTPDDSSLTSAYNKCKRTLTHQGLQKYQRSCKENQVIQSDLTILSSKSISLTTETCDNIWNENKKRSSKVN